MKLFLLSIIKKVLLGSFLVAFKVFLGVIKFTLGTLGLAFSMKVL
jgi:hypothetical protein